MTGCYLFLNGICVAARRKEVWWWCNISRIYSQKMKRKVKEKRLEICCLEMYSTSKCMESGTTINRGNENLFDDRSIVCPLEFSHHSWNPNAAQSLSLSRNIERPSSVSSQSWKGISMSVCLMPEHLSLIYFQEFLALKIFHICKIIFLSWMNLVCSRICFQGIISL